MFCMSDLSVYRVHTRHEYERVLHLRARGPGHHTDDPAFYRDDRDFADNALVLITADLQGEDLGTMRIMNRNTGPVELDDYLDVNRALQTTEQGMAEATRFVVPDHPRRREVELALLKAYYRYCRFHGIHMALISAAADPGRQWREPLFREGEACGLYRKGGNSPMEDYTRMLDMEAIATGFGERDLENTMHVFFNKSIHKQISWS